MNAKRGFPFALLIGVLIVAAPVRPQAADDLAKKASAELRTAERSMFAGKLDDAVKQLESAGALIRQLKTEAPDHRNLRSLESKYSKLKKDIDRRLPKESTAAPKAAPKSDSGAAEAKLPGGVTKRIRDIDSNLESLAGYIARDHIGSPDTTLKNAQNYLKSAKDLLDEIESSYGSQIPAGHPEMEGVKSRIAQAEKDVEAFGIKLAAGGGRPDAEPAPSGDAARALEDGKRVEALNDKYYDQLSLIHGNTLVYGLSVKDAEAALKSIEDVEAQVLPELSPALAEMAERYGTQPMEINNNLHAMGVKGPDQFGTKLGYLIEMAENVVKSRAASAETIARNAENDISSIGGLVPDIRVKRLEETKAKLVIGQKLDPNNPRVNSFLAQIDGLIVEVAAKIEKDIDDKTWAGHVSGFPGPGGTGSLSDAAMDFFRNDDRWGKNPDKKVEILKVAVRGPWQVAEKDIFGRVIRWRLPIHLAITNQDLRKDNIARVYELSILALEGEGNNAPKKPPFDGYWVGNSWNMRLNKLSP